MAQEHFEDQELIMSEQQEDESDLHSENIKNKDAVLFNTDWTVETIFRQIQKNNIDLDPAFQRREAWDELRKSKLIESIISSFPIPNIVLAEQMLSKGKYLVIDGKQRLFSIASFLKGEFALKGLKIHDELNGLKFSDLEEKYRDLVNVIENQTIRTVIIRNWPNEDYLYSVFYRLNSGSLPLSPQELRKALHGGILLDHIDKYIRNSEAFKKIFGVVLDRRMRDVERVLRFIAFDRFYEDYRGDLKKFLDTAVIFYNDNWDKELENIDQSLEKLDRACNVTYLVFEENSFKKWNGEKFERTINLAVFDVMTRYFSDRTLENLPELNKAEIFQGFQDICTNSIIFKESIESTTKTPTATNARYRIWGEKLAPLFKRKLDQEVMRLV